MNLDISWVAPAIPPTCGYKLQYRKNLDTFYTPITGSSGDTSTTVLISAPACYEGSVTSDCCTDLVSGAVPFGVNAYSAFSITAVNSDTGHFNLTVSSTYSNTYATLISGVINYTILSVPHTQAFSITYPSNVTSDTFSIGSNVPGNAIVTSVGSLVYSPVFNHGGQLQQFDALNTPPYFKFFVSGTTIPAYNGSPASLPSFILTQFNVTEVDTSGNTLAGTLLVSWIQHETFASGTTAPYNTVTFNIYDETDAFVGAAVVPSTPLGYRTAFIPLTKAVNELSVTTAFSMKAYWSDGTLIDTHTFYLP
jgi:hypothetical protein